MQDKEFEENYSGGFFPTSYDYLDLFSQRLREESEDISVKISEVVGDITLFYSRIRSDLVYDFVVYLEIGGRSVKAVVNRDADGEMQVAPDACAESPEFAVLKTKIEKILAELRTSNPTGTTSPPPETHFTEEQKKQMEMIKNMVVKMQQNKDQIKMQQDRDQTKTRRPEAKTECIDVCLRFEMKDITNNRDITPEEFFAYFFGKSVGDLFDIKEKGDALVLETTFEYKQTEICAAEKKITLLWKTPSIDAFLKTKIEIVPETMQKMLIKIDTYGVNVKNRQIVSNLWELFFCNRIALFLGASLNSV